MTMFEYFPKNYTWSFATVRAIDTAGSVSEVEEACHTLRDASVPNNAASQEAWYESWHKMAVRVNQLGLDDEKAGHLLSAGRKFYRSSIYFLAAEKMLPFPHPRREKVYEEALEAFGKAMKYRKEPVEWVEVPFEGKRIPCLFSKAPGPGKKPCVVHLNGFDSVKESLYVLSAEEFRRRGVSVLFVDQPGNGGSLRLQKLYGRADTETPVKVCVDYLETRPDVDANRLGVVGLSLGGYYAPRAAAFEKRFKCCVAWAANYNFGARTQLRLVGKGGELAQPAYANRLKWVFGKETVEEAAEAAKGLTLEGVADKITCPLLVVHGENDRIIPLWEAEKTIEAAVNSPNRKLRIFTRVEGGEDHCQLDNHSLGVDYITDWMSEILGGNVEGV